MARDFAPLAAFSLHAKALNLTTSRFVPIVGPSFFQGVNQVAQVNWAKVKAELNKYADLERLKGEVHRLSEELKKFDINSHLSPSAKDRLKSVEAKYHDISKTLHRTQRQVDREVNRVLRNLKTQRARAEKGLKMVKSVALDQRKKLEKASAEIKAKVLGDTKKRRKSGTRKKSTKTTSA